MRKYELPMEMIGDEHVPVVRPFSPDEREIVRPGEHETIEQRLQRLADTSAINIDRYQLAAAERPEMSEHFDFLIASSSNSLDAWRQYYDQEAVLI